MATNRMWVVAEAMERKARCKEKVCIWKHSSSSLMPGLLTFLFFLYVRISLSSLNKRGGDIDKI